MTEFETELSKIEAQYKFIFEALHTNETNARKDKHQKIIDLMRTHNIKNIAVEQAKKGVTIQSCADRDGDWWFMVGNNTYDDYDNKEEAEMINAINQAVELQLLVHKNWGSLCNEYGLNPDFEYW